MAPYAQRPAPITGVKDAAMGRSPKVNSTYHKPGS
jgi:hypothetical protein